MTLMIIGLAVFLGAHSLNLFAPQWRLARLEAMGELAFKATYALVSIAGLTAAIYGYGAMRAAQLPLWQAPLVLYHVVALLMLPAFILLVAAYVPRNHLKAAIGHPMLLATQLWALGHLLVNGRPGDSIFFGAFLLWAAALFITLRSRDRAQGKSYPAGRAGNTLAATVIGAAAWYAVARYLHIYIAGVAAVGGM